MNKELEALSDLRNGGLVKDDVICFTKKAFDKRLDIIEAALKRLEALEIVKDCVEVIEDMAGYRIRIKCGTLSKEEYDLLKEVLS